MCDQTCGGSSGSSRNASRHSSGNKSGAVSALEQALRNAQTPIETSETEEITVNGVRGIFLNKQEVAAWKGSRPIDSYPIHNDSNPEVIQKSGKNVEHVQQINVRFLKAPAGQAGPIIIKQDAASAPSPAPPVIIRQQAGGASTPAPKVIREAPPKSVNVGCKTITIKGACIPPPPRRVIIEKIPAGAGKPGNMCIDRWLAPEGLKRKVIFKPAGGQGAGDAPRNLIIEWAAGSASVKKEVNVKGVVDANPQEYEQQYSSQIVQSSALPQEAKEIQAPSGYKFAADAGQSGLIELEGDVEALAMVDLDAEGLGEYKEYLAKMGITPKPQGGNCGAAPAPAPACGASRPKSAPKCGASPAPKSTGCGC
jgi:hypothetical protein